MLSHSSDKMEKILSPDFMWLIPQLLKINFILTWQGRYNDHEDGFPGVRLIHCTPDVLIPADFPRCGKLDCIACDSGDCIHVLCWGKNKLCFFIFTGLDLTYVSFEKL